MTKQRDAPLRVLYFGTYDRTYPRNAQVISALRTAGVDVVESHVGVWEGQRESWSAGAGAAARIAVAQGRLLARARRAPHADAVVLGYPGHLDLLAARIAAHGKPVVFNPLVSLADTLVGDRARFSSGSLPARALTAVDRRAFGAADLVVADTAADAEFFRQLTETPVDYCFVGAEDRLFTPNRRPREDRFAALFVGKLIPLQGIETILGAAMQAPEIGFRIVGSGQLESLLKDLPPNVEHVPWVEYEALPDELSRTSCALGIFGTSSKARRVIPNKVFQALACACPVVTADTPAARELLTDGESALLVPPGNASALADAVRRLARDGTLARRLSEGGRKIYERKASEAVLGIRWRELLERTAR